MNIEQYRALKAQEELEKTQPQVEQSTEPQEVIQIVEDVVEKPEEDKPITVEIDGKEVTIDELKNGYLRQSDYTKKTQQLSHQRKEVEEAVKFYEHLKHNPDVAQQLQQVINVPQSLDPTQSKIIELEERMYDMMLEKEIETLQSKYSDFEVREVIEMANNRQMTNLEDAYLLVKAQKQSSNIIDVDKIKEDVRKEIMKELESNVETSSIISSGREQVVSTPDTPTLSQGEIKVAQSMGMTPIEYARWRDADKK